MISKDAMGKIFHVITVIVISFLMVGCPTQKRASPDSLEKTSVGKAMPASPKNYLRYSPVFASAGQPSEDYLKFLADQGTDIVINIAPHSARDALNDEKQSVIETGMQYFYIPVIWDEPTQNDVDQFLSFMQQHGESEVFLHCQLNMRASAFAFLHRVINLQSEPAIAIKDMLEIWTPNSTWTELINTALRNHQISYQIEK